MINKELEKLKKKLDFDKGCHVLGYITGDKDETISIEEIENILQYIEQLENKQQKVMKFLIECKKEYIEELKYNCTKRDARLQLLLVDAILEIIGGEERWKLDIV